MPPAGRVTSQCVRVRCQSATDSLYPDADLGRCAESAARNVMQPWPGSAYPLGASYDGAAPTSRCSPRFADPCRLCLFDEAGNEDLVRLARSTGFVWHGYLPSVEPAPALRLPGVRPLRPERRRSVQTRTSCSSTVCQGRRRRGELGRVGVRLPVRRPGHPHDNDSSLHVPKSVGGEPVLRLGPDRPPKTPYHETLIYEAHVKGLTIAHPEIPPRGARHLRGLATR